MIEYLDYWFKLSSNLTMLWLIAEIDFNNKMLSSVIHEGYDGSDMAGFFSAMIPTFIYCMNRERKLLIVREFESDLIITLLFHYYVIISLFHYYIIISLLHYYFMQSVIPLRLQKILTDQWTVSIKLWITFNFLTITMLWLRVLMWA